MTKWRKWRPTCNDGVYALIEQRHCWRAANTCKQTGDSALNRVQTRSPSIYFCALWLDIWRFDLISTRGWGLVTDHLHVKFGDCIISRCCSLRYVFFALCDPVTLTFWPLNHTTLGSFIYRTYGQTNRQNHRQMWTRALLMRLLSDSAWVTNFFWTWQSFSAFNLKSVTVFYQQQRRKKLKGNIFPE